MKINIYCIGKAHNPEYKNLIQFYEKRIKPFAKIEFHIIAPSKRNAKTTLSQIKLDETKLLKNKINFKNHTILLDETGKALNSIEWANNIEKIQLYQGREINFIIGGAYGVIDSFKKECHAVWSLSNLVFPHQMVRAILLEQIYRSFQILNNTGYHHI